MTDNRIVVYGTTWCGDCKRAKQFFGEHLIDYRWIDIEKDDEARHYVERVNGGHRSVPTIVFGDGSILVEPTSAQLAQKMGLTTQAKFKYYELIIIGGGACGLTAASYAARERIRTLVIERRGLGGQAVITGTAGNVPGYPEGISGVELAERLTKEAKRFGAEILLADVARIDLKENYRIVHLTDGSAFNSNAILITSGADYRKLDVPGETKFLGAGVHYCAECDAPFYKNAEQVLVIGGGNSAVEGALVLANYANRVTLLVRGNALRANSVAQEKLLSTPSVDVRFNTVVTELRGSRMLESVVTRNVQTGAVEEMRPAGVFVFIGSEPNNGLVKDLVALDPFGYIMTGHELSRAVQQQVESAPGHIRIPHAMETSVRGIFAAGDVRSGSTKQVASAVAEGASAAIAIREYLRGE